jgi:hypothetical protein
MALVVKAGKRQRGSWAFASRARRGHSHALSHSVGGGPRGMAKAKGGTGVRKGKAEQGTLGKWSPVGSGTTRKRSARRLGPAGLRVERARALARGTSWAGIELCGSGGRSGGFATGRRERWVGSG